MRHCFNQFLDPDCPHLSGACTTTGSRPNYAKLVLLFAEKLSKELFYGLTVVESGEDSVTLPSVEGKSWYSSIVSLLLIQSWRSA